MFALPNYQDLYRRKESGDVEIPWWQKILWFMFR